MLTVVACMGVGGSVGRKGGFCEECEYMSVLLMLLLSCMYLATPSYICVFIFLLINGWSYLSEFFTKLSDWKENPDCFFIWWRHTVFCTCALNRCISVNIHIYMCVCVWERECVRSNKPVRLYELCESVNADSVSIFSLLCVYVKYILFIHRYNISAIIWEKCIFV